VNGSDELGLDHMAGILAFPSFSCYIADNSQFSQALTFIKLRWPLFMLYVMRLYLNHVFYNFGGCSKFLLLAFRTFMEPNRHFTFKMDSCVCDGAIHPD
jgi:hypothetical protein